MALCAIVLAGGRARRLGGIDKVLAHVDGRTLLYRVVAAVADAERVAVAGPRRETDLPRPVVWTPEEPAFGGPAAGVAAGVAALAPGRDDEILVLAGDLVRPLAVVAALPSDSVAVDEAGRRQWACVRVGAGGLIDALVDTGDVSGLPLRHLFGRLDLREVPLSRDACADLDTTDDAREYTDEYR